MSVGSWALSFQGVFQIELTLCSLEVCAVYSLRFTFLLYRCYRQRDLGNESMPSMGARPHARLRACVVSVHVYVKWHFNMHT